jgi:small subunit ribosomal protein S13
MKELVRIANADIPGKKTLYHALRSISGVSYSFSNAICKILKLKDKQKIGELSDQELQRIEQLIRKPEGVPQYLLNRRKDLETGKNLHVIGTDLKLQKEFDVRLMKKIKTYRGMRHAFGLPVRGQRTRGNFRKGVAVGVMKKATKVAAAAGGDKKEKK